MKKILAILCSSMLLSGAALAQTPAAQQSGAAGATGAADPHPVEVRRGAHFVDAARAGPGARQSIGRIDERGHDYYLQLTDARADTGGLSGATPSEAVSWGKVDPERLPDAVVCYVDNTIGLPLLTAYALARRKPRPLKRLYDRRDQMNARLLEAYRAARKFRDERANASALPAV